MPFNEEPLVKGLQDYYATMKDAEDHELVEQKKVLKRLKRRLPACWYEQILEYLDDCEHVYRFSIEKVAKGFKQKEYARFRFVYLDPSDHGPCGDPGYEKVYIPVGGGQYFSFYAYY